MGESVGKRVARGGFLLSSGNTLATVISAVGSIVIARLLTPAEYGLISIALIFPLMLGSLLDLGLSTAFVRFPSLGKNVDRYVTAGLTFKLLVAIASGLFIFLFAGPLASFLARPYITPMLRVLSLYTFAYMVLGSVTRVLIGLGQYLKASVLGVIRNALRASISIALILAGLGVYGAIWSFSIAYTSTLIIAFAFIAGYIKLKCFKLGALKEMLRYSIPLYIPILLGTPVGQYLQMLLAWFATNEEIGNYRIALNLLVPLTIVGGGLSTSLLSALPSLIGEDYKLRDAVRRAPIYVTMIVSPIALALTTFSKPIVCLVYGEAYKLAPLYLGVLALQGLLAPFGRYVVGTYFNAVGATTITMRVRLLSTAVGVPLATILIMKLGVLGLILSSLTAMAFSLIYSLHILYSRFSVKLDIVENVRSLMPSIIASATSYTIMYLLSSSWLGVVLGAFIYVLVLGLTTPIIISRHHLEYLKGLSLGLRIADRIASKILGAELKVADILAKIK